MLHVVLLGILLCPLVVVYNCGLFISAGISVWRLIQHDYHADGVRNLKQALDVLYYLALLQSTIFCYKCINGFAKGFIVNSVAQSGNFDEQSRAGISEYLLEMMAGCQKDRMYTRGRNLITYAVDLMGSKSPDDYMSGLRILDTCAVQMGSSHESGKGYLQWNTLKKHLIMSVSSPNILPKLLQTLGRISIYDRETRGHAARVVASIAHDIHLEEFPGGIRYISSLMDTFEKYRVLQPYEANWLYEKYCESYEEEREQIFREERHGKKLKVHAAQEDSDADLLKDYADLVAEGFLILQKLATNHDNCKVMLGTPCLLPKIMAPVTADLLHPLRGDKNVHINHDAWYRILEGSLRVIVQLTAATGETGSTLRRKISSRKDAIITLDRILECGQCNENLKKKLFGFSRTYTRMQVGRRSLKAEKNL
uniref:Uncharacterized protein n=1 Tax=Avena sativa TaxID=4498 RepID=A0ACD5WGH4_AVESA